MRTGRGRIPAGSAVRIGYDEALSHRMFAGADAVLVPSRFEPCGLTQMYGLRYGTRPRRGRDRRAGRYRDHRQPDGAGGRGGDRRSRSTRPMRWPSARRCGPLVDSHRDTEGWALMQTTRDAPAAWDGMHLLPPMPPSTKAADRVNASLQPGAFPTRLRDHPLAAGRPDPLGATFDGEGVNFAVFSAHAEAIELCLFSDDGRKERARIPSARTGRRHLAHLCRRADAGREIRVSRPRSLRAGTGPPLQPQQAADRPLCQALTGGCAGRTRSWATGSAARGRT